MADTKHPFEVHYLKKDKSLKKIVFDINENFAVNQLADSESVSKNDVFYIKLITSQPPLSYKLLMALMYLTLIITAVVLVRLNDSIYATGDMLFAATAYGLISAVFLAAFASIIKNLYSIAHQPN